MLRLKASAALAGTLHFFERGSASELMEVSGLISQVSSWDPPVCFPNPGAIDEHDLHSFHVVARDLNSSKTSCLHNKYYCD